MIRRPPRSTLFPTRRSSDLSRNSHLTLIIDLDLNHRGYIRQEAPVRRNSDAGSLSMLTLSPPGFFRDHLRNIAQTAGLPRIGVQRGTIIRVLHALEINSARISDQVE